MVGMDERGEIVIVHAQALSHIGHTLGIHLLEQKNICLLGHGFVGQIHKSLVELFTEGNVVRDCIDFAWSDGLAMLLGGS